MRPTNLKTKIFLDSGSAEDTKIVLATLGFLDGQTTNPSLFVKNPKIQERLSRGEKFTKEEINENYKKLIQDIRKLIPEKSVSIEVYANKETHVEEILSQAREMNTWVEKPHIKLPITPAGLEAAHILSSEGLKVNMTLIFQQEQAAAVYAATQGSTKGDIFLSPFVGRLDDIGINGLSLISDIQKIYSLGDAHVEILMASVRGMNHFLKALEAEVDIITVPKKLLLDWAEMGMPLTRINQNSLDQDGLKNIKSENIKLDLEYTDYNIQHDLTDKGLKKFADDWNNIIKK